MLSKINLGLKGFNIETQEVKNVMSVFCFPLYFLTPILGFSIYLDRYTGISFAIFIGYLVIFAAVYIYHAIRHPKMLQSEKYQIEYHKIMLMQESKNPIHVEAQSLIESAPTENPPEILEIEDKGDSI